MKRIENKPLLKLGVLAMLLIFVASVTLVAATQGNSVLTCAAQEDKKGKLCVAGDKDGITKFKAEGNGGKVNGDYNNPVDLIAFTLPLGGIDTVEITDNQRPPATDYWIIDQTVTPWKTYGPLTKKEFEKKKKELREI